MKQIITVIAVGLIATGAWAKDIDWQKNYDEAVAKAKKDKKLVMVDVYTDWCGWCKKLDKDVYSNNDVQEQLGKSFVALKINPEENSKNAALVRQFGSHGFPHIVFLDAEGKKVAEQVGYPCNHCTSTEAAKLFVHVLEEAAKNLKK